MNKQLTKKILLTIGLLLLVGMAVYFLTIYFSTYRYYIKELEELKQLNLKSETIIESLQKNMVILIFKFVFVFLNITLYLYIIYRTWRLNLLVNFRYDLEEYKIKKQEKLQKKKETKKLKLQEKINKL